MVAAKVSTGFGQIKYHEVEGIPFRLFGSLLQHETEWFESRSDSRISNIKKVLELAQKIAVNESITEDEALAKVQDMGNPDHSNLALRYAAELDEINTSGYTEAQFRRDIAVMMINSRVSRQWLVNQLPTFEESFDITFDDPQKPWFTDVLAKKLPVKLINAITEFCANEKSEWAEPPVDQSVEEDKSLGK
jgi:hypothetical protein